MTTLILKKLAEKAKKQAEKFGSKSKFKKIGDNLYTLTSYDSDGYWYKETFQIIRGRKKHIRTEHQSGDIW